MILAIPLPPEETWIQFPVVAVIVLCFALAFTGIFFLVRWIWGEYKCERDKDLLWREGQNALCEKASAEQNELWRATIKERDIRFEKYDAERQGTLAAITISLGGIAHQLADHDLQAKTILNLTERIDDNTRPKPRAS